jgi:hypothetical protein
VVCQGKFEQDTRYSYSKSSLVSKHRPKRLQAAQEEALKYDATITHKSLKHLFPNAHPYMCLGNSSGYNKLEGKRVLVLGTPHAPQFVYLLFAKALGIRIQSRDSLALVNRRITRNGYNFIFPTFERDVMTNIQCFFIEKALLQPVGRPRLLRQAEAEAKVLSNFPLRYFWVGDPTVNVEEYQVSPESVKEEDCLYIDF